MSAVQPIIKNTFFPPLKRARLTTLQVNLGYLCNQQCTHCHVNAGPKRKELMSRATVEQVLCYLRAAKITTLDVTGGAPEMNPHFRELVSAARSQGVRVMDRCNLTILEQPGYEDMAQFLADHQVEVVASLPCYLEDNVDKQRGDGVFQSSLRALQKLNRLGYAAADNALTLDLVHNPVGPYLPPSQAALEQDYKRELFDRYGIVFNHLYTITNMPIKRFAAELKKAGQYEQYMELLQGAHQDTNLAGVMCRSLISVDWQGYVYDCDFNQMLGLPLRLNGKARMHISELMDTGMEGRPIVIGDHCYGCTAGQGSSCGGALNQEAHQS
ncbi:MAG: arsenosugar biosynthesis radical SAM protein ArsS [Gammaproteobacteria bacterium]|nr:arsenosugar biosynthesis radical SAM protein ArsS [Gammaproteobacteria bacterium]